MRFRFQSYGECHIVPVIDKAGIVTSNQSHFRGLPHLPHLTYTNAPYGPTSDPNPVLRPAYSITIELRDFTPARPGRSKNTRLPTPARHPIRARFAKETKHTLNVHQTKSLSPDPRNARNTSHATGGKELQSEEKHSNVASLGGVYMRTSSIVWLLVAFLG